MKMKRLGIMAALVLGVGLGWLGAQVELPEAEAQVGGSWTYAQVVSELDVVAGKITSQRQNMIRGYALIELADNELGAMPTDYASLDTTITNAPANDTYTPIKNQWAALVSEFNALKTESAAQKAALDAL